MTSKERLDQHDKQLAKHEHQLNRIRDLIEGGMRLVRADRIDIRLLAKDIRALSAAQKKTDANLNGLISALRQSGGNGHSKAKVDLQ